jgi:hypothetical protein
MIDLDKLEHRLMMVSAADDGDMILVPREQSLDLIAEIRRLREALQLIADGDGDAEAWVLYAARSALTGDDE